MSNVARGSDPTPKRELVEAREVKRRPRPPGSASWLLDPDLDLASLRYRDLRKRSRLISDAARSPDAPIRPRKAFTNEQRKAVCVLAAQSKLTHEALASVFHTNKTTIARTLKHSEKWLSSDLTKNAKVARKRYPTHVSVEASILPWIWDCKRKGILVTDDAIRAKTMEIAAEYNMFDQPRPFACSPKWLRGVKSRLGIVNGIVTLGKKIEPQREEEPSGSMTAGSPEASLEPSKASSESCSSQSIADLVFDAGTASASSMYSVPREPAEVEPHVATDIALPVVSTSASETDRETMDSLPVWVQDVSPVPIMEYALPRLPYDTSSDLAFPELYMPDWSYMPTPELATAVDQYGDYDQRHIDSSLESQCESSLALPGMPSFAEGSAAPIPSAPLDYNIGMILADSALKGATASSNCPPGLPLPPSSAWPMHASPSCMQSIDLSMPSNLPADPFSIFDQQLCVSQEGIGVPAEEMPNWPIEDLLGDVGTSSSQGDAGSPYDVMSSGALLPPQWPSWSSNGLVGSDYLFAST